MLGAAETLRARAKSFSALYMVFLTREYWVPGIIMKQEKTVCWAREEERVVRTETSYMMPLLTVVVLVSPRAGLSW